MNTWVIILIVGALIVAGPQGLCAKTEAEPAGGTGPNDTVGGPGQKVSATPTATVGAPGQAAVPGQKESATTMVCGGPTPGALSGSYKLLAAGGTAEIPFEVALNHVLIPVRVDGSEPFKLILDTGMPYDGAVIHQSPRTDRLSLPNVQEVQVMTGESGSGSPSKVATGVTLGLPGVELTNESVTILSGASEMLKCHQAEGVIGLALFGRFVVEIDYDDMVVRLTEPAKFKYTGGGQSLPAPLAEMNIPHTDLEVTLAGGKTILAHLVIDTGAGHALSLNVGSQEDITAPPNAIEYSAGRTIFGEIPGRIGRVERIRLGRYTLDNVVTSFKSNLPAPLAACEKDGNLGNAALRRFNPVFDYANQRIILEPNKHFAEPFKFNMAGIATTCADKDSLAIERVIPGSPASEAGLEAGDVITEINHRPAAQFTRDQLTGLLTEEGKKVSLRVSRDGHAREVTLVMRELI